MAKSRSGSEGSDAASNPEITDITGAGTSGVSDSLASYLSATDQQLLGVVETSVNARAINTADQVTAIVSNYAPRVIDYTNQRLMTLEGGDAISSFCSQLSASIGAGLLPAQSTAGELPAA